MLICPHIVLSWWHLTEELQAKSLSFKEQKEKKKNRRRRRRAGYATQWNCPSVTRSLVVLLALMLVNFLLILFNPTRSTQQLDLLRPCEGVAELVLLAACGCVCSSAPPPHWAKPTRPPWVNLEPGHWARTGLILIPQSYFSANLTFTKHGKDQRCALRVRVSRQTQGQ